MRDHGDAHAARQALQAAEAARAAARSRPVAPGWFAPARGLLFAVGVGLVSGPWPEHGAVLVAGMAVLLAFLAVHAVVISRGGVITMPGGPLPRRLMNQLGPATVYGLGWLAAIPFGQGVGALCAAVLGGAALWTVTALDGHAR
ncbi:hypothetical protein AB0C33_47730 [Nonomuraea sp. NPDC048881]|uniref:hypothetical protein n=1 Tax=Nonomuraea sp. NPDC048881 TaxID=3155030 RepID=UPI0033E0A877